MLSVVRSAALAGFEGLLIQVEVNVAGGFPGFEIVGLADTAVRESRERVKAALANNGFRIPRGRITVNLAPAAVRKHGPGLDLPIALGILLASEQLPASRELEEAIICGELSLEGSIRPVRGALAMALQAVRAGCKTMVVPEGNTAETAVVPGIDVLGVSSLDCIAKHCRQGATLKKQAMPANSKSVTTWKHDMADICGQEGARRALEVAAAGGHNLLFQGPPGAGKTMLANSLPGILPPLSAAQALEVNQVYSVAGLLPRDGLLQHPPFRHPHHSASTGGMVGGGAHPRPGEVSLAHNGVLYLDEIPEFRREVLELLRQPMETGEVTIVRAHGAYTFPARFMLVAAANPCSCGYAGTEGFECRCTASQLQRYQTRLSGPILDRIDMWCEVPHLEYSRLRTTGREESSGAVRERVAQARKIQHHRLAGEGVSINALLDSRLVEKYCELSPEAESLLSNAYRRFRFSARTVHKMMKVARTIADLDAHHCIDSAAMAEALSYRTLFASN